MIIRKLRGPRIGGQSFESPSVFWSKEPGKGEFPDAPRSFMMLQSAWFDRAHKADEYIERSELASCDAFLDGLIADIAR